MAHTVHTDVQIYLGGFDLSGDSNSFSESRSQGTPEDSTFGSQFRQRLPGVRDVSFALAGFSDFDANEVDEQLHNGFGVTPATPLLWAPDGTVLGDPCFFGRIRRGSYGSGGAFGDAAKFDLAGSIATGVWHRGSLLDPHHEVTAVGNSTPVQIGPQSATQTLFGHLAVTRFTELTALAILIQSASAETFGSPATRLSFVAATGAGAQLLSVAGSTLTTAQRAHEWYRVRVMTYTEAAGATDSGADIAVGASIS